jgi:phosphatidylserine/phosphatidylglycerophosphate/cardiolipin synthase-like enzyme
MRNAVAFANNDVITIAWSYGKRPDGCMGFALYRIDAKGKETVLPSHAVFKGETIQPGQTTAQYPVQKFYWKDPYARLVAEQTRSFSFRYKVVPLEGKPGNLRPMTTLPILTTNQVDLTAECSPSLSATFNRGLISTQHVSQALKGNLNKNQFVQKISNKTDQLRKDLSGDMVSTLTDFLKRTQKGGEIYAALYELTDAELIASLVAVKQKLNIVLADIVAKPSKNKQGLTGLAEKAPAPAGKKGKTQKSAAKGHPSQGAIAENDNARKQISSSAGTDKFLYRLPPSGHIVHNKFLIYVDSRNKAQAVLTGSTNWTPTGLCAQTNNALVIDDSLVAERYMNYWKTLKADQEKHQKDPKDSKLFQGTAMRSFDGKAVAPFRLDTKVPSGDPTTPSSLTSYFSPNTPRARSKKKGTELEPIDMKDLETRVKQAKHAVLFLAFIPGTPSITNFAAEAQKANKNLFVRGCVTAPDAAGTFYYTLRGTSPPKRQPVVKGKAKAPKKPVPQDARVIAADALDKADAPGGWVAELLKAGFAITHDKIVVIDPFADDCVVVTGSHNLGYQASYNNDENLVMIQGNKRLAMAYATHVLDVYDHFSWRWATRRNAKTMDANLKSTPDEWLNWYFDANGDIKTAQLKFWMQATVN